MNLTRRSLLKSMSLFALGTPALLGRREALAQVQDRRFLIVLSASGGGSLIDSFLAIRASESANASTINTYEDARVQNIPDSPFRAIDSSGTSVGAIPIPFEARQSSFVAKHKNDIMVVTHTGTSVNHGIAQKRSVTGNEAWSGRTLQEMVALQYGEGCAIPNVVMSNGTTYVDPGTDRSLPARCFGEPVAAPALWPLALHGTKGLLGTADRAFVEMARKKRDEKLDAESKFARVFAGSPKLELWKNQRLSAPRLEMDDLITKLMLFQNSEKYPLTSHGLLESPDGRLVREKFPRFDQDQLQAQAALAFLLLKHRVSVSVTIGPSFNAELADGVTLNGGGAEAGDLINPPIAFDFSHQSHRATQAMMWDRIMRTADGLIDLLRAEEYANGESMWDRSMIYIATDFGREKVRPANAEDFGTSHHLNNGVVVISPMANGNKVLGGVDKNTGLTYGFNLASGEPEPGRTTSEGELYSGLLGALRVDTTGSGLPDVRAMRRG